MAYKSKTKAIVLSRSYFGESDMYVHFLTQDTGVISTLAKAARKSKRRYVGGLDLFCHDEIFLRGDPRDKPYLIELSVLNTFTKIRADLDKAIAAGKCVQWIRKLLSPGNHVRGVYSLLGQTLALIENENDSARLEALLLTFRFKLLGLLGLKPQIENCVGCGSEIQAPLSFDIAAGGAQCRNCTSLEAERIVLDQQSYDLIQDVDRLRFGLWEEAQFSQAKVKPILALITQFASFHSHTRLP